MRLTKIAVNGFKSLVDFAMDMPKFTCLIGLNGSGKSTVLQFIDFLSQLVRGDIGAWLNERGWEPGDIRSKLAPPRQVIDFTAELLLDDGMKVTWAARYNLKEQRCTGEAFDMRGTGPESDWTLLALERQRLQTWDPDPLGAMKEKLRAEPIAFEYQGSVLSQLKDEMLPEALKEVRAFFRNAKSFDMLAPQSLRRRGRESGGSIGLSGQHLSAFLHELAPKEQRRVAEELKRAYPALESVLTQSLRSGWKQLSIAEKYGDRPLLTEARHINDGMLRLLAILAELRSAHEFLLFDEIENGINAELVEFLVDILMGAPQQVMVTTHSPMILNYLEDDAARDSVIYLYRGLDGRTRQVRFFDIPSMDAKLAVMGPGEAFVDTNLVELAAEIDALQEGF